jgi:hypothetical protein
MATGFNGVGALAATVLKRLTGHDQFLELCTAASSVEWAAALNATVFPVDVEGYSQQAATELCASLYSGISAGRALSSAGDVETVIDGLLALDNDAPILEVEEIFSGEEVNRLNKLVYRLAGPELTAEELGRAIATINARVKGYERRIERQNRVNIVGLLAALSVATQYPSGALRFLPLGVWLVSYLFKDAQPKSAAGRTIIDWTRSLNAWTTGDVVLVSRIRRKLIS